MLGQVEDEFGRAGGRDVAVAVAHGGRFSFDHAGFFGCSWDGGKKEEGIKLITPYE